MTDKELKKLAKENNFEPTYELIQFARLAIMKTRINELALFAENTRAAVKKEREACAEIAENWRCNGVPRTGVANEIRKRGKK